jgi:hypothetical protein
MVNIIISHTNIGEKEKISKILEDSIISPRNIAIFVTRTLNYLCNNCENVWDGFLGSSHPLGEYKLHFMMNIFQ